MGQTIPSSSIGCWFHLPASFLSSILCDCRWPCAEVKMKTNMYCCIGSVHFVNLCIVLCLSGHNALQMFSKVKSGKVSYKLADTAEKAKTLVTVGGLSEASAEGTRVVCVYRVTPYYVLLWGQCVCECVNVCMLVLLYTCEHTFPCISGRYNSFLL